MLFAAYAPDGIEFSTSLTLNAQGRETSRQMTPLRYSHQKDLEMSFQSRLPFRIYWYLPNRHLITPFWACMPKVHKVGKSGGTPCCAPIGERLPR
ncbi:hypothetical protein ALQ36_200065 [Pseudomonas syringae pv. primulae]|uniref:Uncharacterized protein n=1 Tax=Pseudomonas syringae pv. primulae TaxID=251707 RepID=A0A3M3YCS9_9PSED|nr:hypothetical protein ALQ36_200065 [Pseudomonas syringae pv. primulae]